MRAYVEIGTSPTAHTHSTQFYLINILEFISCSEQCAFLCSEYGKHAAVTHCIWWILGSYPCQQIFHVNFSHRISYRKWLVQISKWHKNRLSDDWMSILCQQRVSSVFEWCGDDIIKCNMWHCSNLVAHSTNHIKEHIRMKLNSQASSMPFYCKLFLSSGR